jgi:hypothetical protein
LEEILVGIDFSLNSPAFCILSDGNFSWTSITRSERSADSLTKNKKKPFSVLSEKDEFEIIFLDKKQIPDDYSGRERTKIIYFYEIAELIWDRILEKIGDKKFKVAMEGLSFSSNGNALIDISMATAFLRLLIIKRVGAENFHVFSPTSIKKFAVKGNAKKDELYDALISVSKDETNLYQFTSILRDNRSEWITPAGQVNKPLDDLVDATWITLYLKSLIV